ncbi:MAG: DUF5103 domain-containing protein [Weeksellaceae bacterium]|nr:DUF5103 domain-containing protein [Weeksellaceae bacterium]
MKNGILLFVVLCFQWTSAQVYREIQAPENIKTIQLFNPQTNDLTPVIRLGSEYLILSFDDLNQGYKEYKYKIEHYNADWTPSGIFQSEYLNGFSTNYINNYTNSFNTYLNYTHYEVSIPNRDVSLKLAGNYVIKVFTEDENNPEFVRRFAIYDSKKVSIGISEERALGSGDMNQRISVVAGSAQMNLTETPDGATLFIMKNGNWEDNLVLKRPQFMNPSQLTYKDQKILFEGGSEYLWFDTKNLDVAAMSTERIFRQDSIYHTVLRPDTPTKHLGYFDNADVNGAFYIRNIKTPDQTRSGSEADYTWVHFALDEFDDENGTKELYVVGAFNNWQLLPAYRLKLTETNYWETAVLLKQGYYNYQYAVYDKSTGNVSYSAINGSFWQTENIYQALFYYRPWGHRYDVLVGYGEVNTRN